MIYFIPQKNIKKIFNSVLCQNTYSKITKNIYTFLYPDLSIMVDFERISLNSGPLFLLKK